MEQCIDDLGDRIAHTAAHLDAAHHRLLTDLREFDARGGWHRQGGRTCGHWLSWRVGWGLGAAREHLRVARALGGLPLIDEALRQGELSYAKVRALTRVATPQNERLLLEDARLMTGQQLEVLCRKYAVVQRHAGAARPQDERPERYVQRREVASGMIRIEAVLHPEEAALVWQALDVVARALMNGPSAAAGVPAETSPTTDGTANASITGDRVPAETSDATSYREFATGARFDRADALMALVRSFAARPVLEAQPTTPVEITLTVPAAGLTADAALTVDHIGVLGDGDAVSPAAARRMACDAAIVTVIEGADGAPLALGRRSRVMSTALKRALLKRDRTCRFPGCTNHLYVEGHHIEHWADGGETALGNLVTLCSHHHRFVHEFRYQVELGPDGEPRFRDPHGREVRAVPIARPAGEVGWGPLVAALQRAGVAPTAPPCWDGSDVDDGLLISALCRADDAADDEACLGDEHDLWVPRIERCKQGADRG
jgi:hypothetical protein